MKKSKKFYLWFKELQRLAKEKDLSYLIGDMESHRDSFNDGESPNDELGNQIDAANASL